MKHIEFEKALLKDGTEINIQQKSIDHLNKLDYDYLSYNGKYNTMDDFKQDVCLDISDYKEIYNLFDYYKNCKKWPFASKCDYYKKCFIEPFEEIFGIDFSENYIFPENIKKEYFALINICQLFYKAFDKKWFYYLSYGLSVDLKVDEVGGTREYKQSTLFCKYFTRKCYFNNYGKFCNMDYNKLSEYNVILENNIKLLPKEHFNFLRNYCIACIGLYDLYSFCLVSEYLTDIYPTHKKYKWDNIYRESICRLMQTTNNPVLKKCLILYYREYKINYVSSNLHISRCIKIGINLVNKKYKKYVKTIKEKSSLPNEIMDLIIDFI
jgi:hypothetical protein